MSSWGSVLRLVERRRGLVAAAIALAAVQTLALLPVALLVRRIFDVQIPERDTTGIVVSGVLALVCYAASAGVLVLSRSLLITTTKAAVVDLRERVADHLYVLPRRWLDARGRGDLHARMVHDTEAVDVMLNQLLTQLAPAGVVGIALCGLAAYLNPVLLAALLAVAIVMLAVNRWTRHLYQSRIARFRSAMAAFSGDSQEALDALEASRVHGVMRWQRARRSGPIQRLGEAGAVLVRTQSVDYAVHGLLAASSGVVVLVVGGILVADEAMSFGSLLGFYAVVALLLRQVGPVVSGVPAVMAGRTALFHLEAMLSEGADPEYTGTARPEFDGSLRVDHVSYAYDGELVLDDVDLVIEPGEHLAIMGPNGAGKSTLVSLLLGIRRPDSGTILAGGVPLDDLDLPALRRQIGVVLQEPVLMRGTIAENIAWGRVEPASPAVRAAARRATAAAFIDALPGGYETELGDDGAGLSGGERQRIAIARALVGAPVLLLLDEPSNHLHRASVDLVLDALTDLPGAPTIVTVTHDAEVAARADRVVMLRDGRVVAAPVSP